MRKAKFKFQTDSEALLNLEQHVQHTIKRKAALPLDLPLAKQLLGAIDRLRDEQARLQTEKREVAKAKQAQAELTARLQQYQKAERTIELSYLKRIEDMVSQQRKVDESRLAKEKRLEESIQSLRFELADKNKEVQACQATIKELQEQRNKLQRENEEANLQCGKLRQSLRLLFQNHARGRRPKNPPQQATLLCLINSKARYGLLRFLNASEVLNLRSLNKSTMLSMGMDPGVGDLLLGQLRVRDKQKLARAMKELSYFRLLREKVPEEVHQMTLFKYFVLHRQAGIFMAPVLNKAGQMFDQHSYDMGDEISFEEEMGMVSPPEDRPAKRDSLVAALTAQAQKEFDRLKEVDELFVAPGHIVEKYLEERIVVQQDINEEIGQQLARLKSVVKGSKAQELLQLNYVRLYVFSKLLVNEVRGLQQAMDVLLDLIVNKFKHEMQRLSQIEDLLSSLAAERHSKTFFSNKVKSQEQKILVYENEILSREVRIKQLAKQLKEQEDRLRALQEGGECRERALRDLQGECVSLRESNLRLTAALSRSQEDLEMIRCIISDLSQEA